MIALGTRVEKFNTEEGDTHKDGDLGTVMAILPVPDQFSNLIVGKVIKYGYGVKWDDFDGDLVWILDYKVRAI